jgi:hypothetical protein
MSDFGHLSGRPESWDDLRPNHRHVLTMVEGHRAATGRPFPPMTVGNRRLSAAICDLLPSKMVANTDRSAPGGLTLTLLELDLYGVLRTEACGLSLSQFGLSLLGCTDLARCRLAGAVQRMHLLAAALTVDSQNTGPGEVPPS